MAVFSGLWQGHHGRAEHLEARRLAEENLAIASKHGDVGRLAHASRILGGTLCLSGALVEARHQLERALELVDSERLNAIGTQLTHSLHVVSSGNVFPLTFLSWTLCLLGYPQRAKAAAAQAVALAEGEREINAMVFGTALSAHMRLSAFGTGPEHAGQFFDEMVEHCKKHHLANYEHWSRFHRGNLWTMRGQIERGIEEMEAAMAMENRGSRLYRTQHLGLMAAAHARLGRSDVCLELLNEAIQTAETTNVRFVEAELWRLRGEMLLARGRLEDGLIALKQALDIARQQQARWWELRTATTLAKHWGSEGRKTDGYKLLAPVYSWFTEGFELADLKASKALLEELSN